MCIVVRALIVVLYIMPLIVALVITVIVTEPILIFLPASIITSLTSVRIIAWFARFVIYISRVILGSYFISHKSRSIFVVEFVEILAKSHPDLALEVVWHQVKCENLYKTLEGGFIPLCSFQA